MARGRIVSADLPMAEVGYAKRGWPANVVRFLKRSGLRLDQVWWCGACGVVAVAVDAFQRAQLDRLGFVDGLCPDCRKRGRR
jgi:hypothetical protein